MPSDSPTAQHLVFEDSMRSLPRALRGSIVTNLAAAGLLCAVMWRWQPPGELTAWLCGLLFVHTWRLLMGTLLRQWQGAARRPLDAQRKARRTLVDATLLAAYWGASSVVLFDPTHVQVMFAWALVLGGTAAGSIGAHAHHPRVSWCFLPLLIGPFALRALIEPSAESRFLGAGMLLLLGYLLYYGRQHARTLRHMIELRHENSELVQELRAQTLALHQANAAKTRFFAAASHDLRQPLQAIGLYLSVVASGPSNPHAVNSMGQCLEALDRLLESVMDISRLDAGKVTPAPEPVGLGDLMERMVRMYDMAAKQKGLRLRIRPSQAWTLVDPVLLERMMSNLLSNAIRYTEQGGVLLAVRPKGDAWSLQIIDTGIGIPEASRDIIFEEFVQLHNPERDPALGNGLGLPTVRRIASLIGTPVQVRSRPGRGSVFAITVPRMEARSPVQQITPSPLGAGLRGKILVVEDNAAVRDALVLLLGNWGLTVRSATSAIAAIECLRSERFDAVLCDWRLPGEPDGLAVLRQARLLQPALRLAVLITGEDEQRLQDARDEFAVLRKPVRPLRLRALLSSHLI
jgi:two-component system, sensor histidine kinase